MKTMSLACASLRFSFFMHKKKTTHPATPSKTSFTKNCLTYFHGSKTPKHYGGLIRFNLESLNSVGWSRSTLFCYTGHKLRGQVIYNHRQLPRDHQT